MIIAFVDNTDFYAAGIESEKEMQNIVKTHADLCEATGGKIQKTKIQTFAWRWGMVNGNFQLFDVPNVLTVHETKVKQLKVNECARTLGVTMGPSIQWKSQFEVMRRKLNESVRKLMNSELKTWQVHIYFNIYLVKSVFFGCGIVELNERELHEMERICEKPILRKLHLSEKFPRRMMCVDKKSLGLGLMRPKTIMSMLKLKQCFGNMRLLNNASDMIKTNSENEQILSGRSKNIHEIKCEERWWPHTWIDEVKKSCEERDIDVIENIDRTTITANKTVMDLACEYVKDKPKCEDMHEKINHVRLHKKVYLPCELLGMNGKSRTD